MPLPPCSNHGRNDSQDDRCCNQRRRIVGKRADYCPVLLVDRSESRATALEDEPDQAAGDRSDAAHGAAEALIGAPSGLGRQNAGLRQGRLT